MMIKVDRMEMLREEKKATICMGLISAIVSVYTLVFVLADAMWNRFGKKKSILAGIYGVVIATCIFAGTIREYTPADCIKPYFHYVDNLFHMDPFRLSVASLYGLWFLFKGHLLAEGVEEWVVEDRNRKDKKLLPRGTFNYESREHMLLNGTTGSGKGVSINHMVKHAIETSQELIVVSAKQASTDPYSQLAYVRKLCKMHGRKLYVVSMDPEVEDRCIYNPFKFVTKTEMENALNHMIQSDSHFYMSNFVAWVLRIFTAIRAAGEEVTLSKILDLYEYKYYGNYISRKVAEGKITDPAPFLKPKIRRYAQTASNDSANLDLIFDAGEEVFDDSWERGSISIREALEQHAVIFFDLNGVSSAAAVSLIGACITAEIQHVAREFSDPDVLKTVVMDECSFYVTDMLVSCLALARSAGYKFILSTQGPSDLCGPEGDQKMLSQIINNCNAFGTLRINDPEDAEKAAEIIGTVVQAENTRRVNWIDLSGEGSLKPIHVLPAHPSRIKRLKKLEMIYYEKNPGAHKDNGPVLVTWRTDDL